MAASAFLFVYGTLRGDLAHPMGAVLAKHAARICSARFRGQLFDLGNYPGAVPSHDTADRVVGELYRIEPGREAALFAELDRYEGCDPGAPSEGEYIRVRAQVEPEGGDPLEAWLYQYNRPTRSLSRIISGDYCAHLRATREEG